MTYGIANWTQEGRDRWAGYCAFLDAFGSGVEFSLYPRFVEKVPKIRRRKKKPTAPFHYHGPET